MLASGACRNRPPAAEAHPPAPHVVGAAELRRELASFRGQPLVVNFWASWCDPCIEEFPELVKIACTWRPRGVRFVSVSADDAQKLEPMRRALERFGAPFDALFVGGADGDAIIRQTDPKWTGALPATFVYDASGKQVAKRLGKIDSAMVAGWLTPLVRK